MAALKGGALNVLLESDFSRLTQKKNLSDPFKFCEQRNVVDFSLCVSMLFF